MPPTYNHSEFCEYQKNQYYDSQGDFCKLCDRCMIGWGLAHFEERDFDIDPVHGALGCRHCVPCGTGFYSAHYSYENCMPCTNCQKEGRHQNRPCSQTQDTICGNILEGRSTNNNVATENVYLIIGLLLGGILLVGGIVTFIYRCLKKKRSKRKCKKKDVEKDAVTKNLISSDTTLSTENSMPSSNTSSTSLSNCGKSDLSTDGNGDIFNQQPTVIQKIKEWKCLHDPTEELSYPLARLISKPLAVDNTFYDIGLHLGLSDEDINIIRSDKRDSVVEQAYETLKKWKQLKASEATVFSILSSLLSLQCYDIANTLCDLYDRDMYNKKIQPNIS